MVTLDYNCLDELMVKDIPLSQRPILHILKLLEDFNVPTSAIANAIGNDLGVATRVLRLANSKMVNTSRQVTSLNSAVLMLGREKLYKMVSLMIDITDTDVLNCNNTSFTIEDRIWKHSLAVGYAAREFIIMKRQVGSEEAFLAGIFHDIGKLLFLRYDPSFYRVMVQEQANSDQELIEKELSVYGFTHAQVGWMAATRWDLPRNICEVIASHHYTENEAPDSPIAIAVEAADSLVSTIGFGIHNQKKTEQEVEDIFVALGVKLNISLTNVKLIATTTESTMKWLTKLF